jgi:uncharacterized damage-inducible protein DinB
MACALSHIVRQAGCNRWSNYRLLGACSQLSDQERDAKRVSFFPSISQTLLHILLVDQYYVDHLLGGVRGNSVFTDAPKSMPFATLAELQFEQDLKLMAFCESCDEAALDKIVELKRGEGRIQVETVGNLLPHLYNHSVHHRGQVHAMLAGTHVAPPQLDEFFTDGDLCFRQDDLSEMLTTPYHGYADH